MKVLYKDEKFQKKIKRKKAREEEKLKWTDACIVMCNIVYQEAVSAIQEILMEEIYCVTAHSYIEFCNGGYPSKLYSEYCKIPHDGYNEDRVLKLIIIVEWWQFKIIMKSYKNLLTFSIIRI